MKKIISILIFIPLLCTYLFASEELTGGILDDKVNSDHEDYGAYLIFGEVNDTLFFTSSRPVKNRRPIAMAAEIFFSVRPAADRMTKPINKGWGKAQRIVTEASRIAQFTRGSQALSSDRIIFAAERDMSTENASGTSYLFDLWQMTKRQDGFSLPEPIDEVNDVDAWDSQPALSTDGKTLFFISNREGGSGGLDIWYSVRDASGKWTAPLPVPNINTPGDEFSPHCGTDGRFYFSTNWDYEQNEKGDRGKDIYRADYNTINGVQLPVNPINLDDAIRKDAETYGLAIPGDIYYNSEADDEFPFITPDRTGIFITSNRESSYDKRDIYAFKLPKSRIMLRVLVREKILDANGNVLVPATLKSGLPLNIVDEASGVSKDILSGENYDVDADRTYRIEFTKFVEEECYQNKIEGPHEMKVLAARPWGPDTLYTVEALITRQKIEIPPIVFHSTDTLPYFITGYWYPNTSKNIGIYRQREASGFFDETGFVDSTGHDYDFISGRIDDVFAERIYKPLEELLPAFQDFCQDTLFLKVTIHGYTDPRGLSAGNEHPYRPQSRYKRVYGDETVEVGVDAKGSDLVIPNGIDMFKRKWPVDPNDKNGKWVSLPDEGEEGNVLLSKLRAYYTFVTFDRDMRERSPIYSQLRDNGRVILDAEGFGIDKDGYKERNLRDDPQSRRIEIYVDILRPEEISTHKRIKGGTELVMKSQLIQNEDTPVAPDKKVEAPEKKKVTEFNKPKKEEPKATIKIKEPKKPEDEPKMLTNQKPVKLEEIKPAKEIKENISKPPRPLDPPVDIPEKPKKIDLCWSLHYNNYEEKKGADDAADILRTHGVKDVRVEEYFDNFGTRSYRLRSGCYKTANDAAAEIKNLREAVNAIGLNSKPSIVR